MERLTLELEQLRMQGVLFGAQLVNDMCYARFKASQGALVPRLSVILEVSAYPHRYQEIRLVPKYESQPDCKAVSDMFHGYFEKKLQVQPQPWLLTTIVQLYYEVAHKAAERILQRFGTLDLPEHLAQPPVQAAAPAPAPVAAAAYAQQYHYPAGAGSGAGAGAAHR